MNQLAETRTPLRKVHFIGICGAGMSATALLLRERGATVTGTDEGAYPPITDVLAIAGIDFRTTYAASNIPDDVDAIVIGKHAKLVPESNEEVRAAFATGKEILSFPQVLARMTADARRLVVAGSYAKSTCTALMAWCLALAGKKPGWFVGAATVTPDRTASLGAGQLFVFEGDEYPSANFDDMSKFLHYAPRDVLLTALAHDHVNVYPTHEDYLVPFRKLVAGIPAGGSLFACIDDETIRRELPNMRTAAQVTTYGFSPDADWRAEDVVYGHGAAFRLVGPDLSLQLVTGMLGAHNVQNVIGVASLLLARGLLTREEVRACVATFEAPKRRMDLLSRKTRIPVYEGFGSSHEKARAAIDAMRLHFPERRLVIVFEPHTFSWRNRASLHWYDDVFGGAGRVFVFEPPQHGATTHAQLGLDEIVGRIAASGTDAIGIEDHESGRAQILADLGADDAVLVLSSGNLGGMVPPLVRELEQRFPA